MEAFTGFLLLTEKKLYEQVERRTRRCHLLVIEIHVYRQRPYLSETLGSSPEENFYGRRVVNARLPLSSTSCIPTMPTLELNNDVMGQQQLFECLGSELDQSRTAGQPSEGRRSIGRVPLFNPTHGSAIEDCTCSHTQGNQ